MNKDIFGRLVALITWPLSPKKRVKFYFDEYIRVFDILSFYEVIFI